MHFSPWYNPYIVMVKTKSKLDLSSLTSVTPLDGRYRNRISELTEHVSEYGLIRIRVEIEIRYIITLSKEKVIRSFTKKEIALLLDLYENFSIADAKQVKEIEKETRHDVKAVERYIRKKLKNTRLENITEMVHIGLTSEDINNIAYRLMIHRAIQDVCLPALDTIVQQLVEKAKQYKTIPMMARTHGQPAVPTTLGKEIIFFATRLQKQLQLLRSLQLSGKLTGAVGNFNALQFAFPNVSWIRFSEKFVTSFHLIPNLITTQLNPYDDVCELIQIMQRINTILIDFDQDMWRYISDGWFVQEVKKGEVGSSTMPQKVNPIDFENSEGNLGMANALFEFMVRKLPVSRLQRDLSDSTVIRNIGTAIGYCLCGYTSTITGLGRVQSNTKKISEDLHNDWSILAEAVQTMLRVKHVPDPYSMIASLSRGKHMGKEMWIAWVASLPIDEKQKEIFKDLTPETYIGLAIQLTDMAIAKIQSK